MLLLVFWDPTAGDEDRGSVWTLEGRDDLVSVFAFVDAWPEEHFLVVTVDAGCEDAAVVEGGELGCVDVEWEWEWGTDEALGAEGY